MNLNLALAIIVLTLSVQNSLAQNGREFDEIKSLVSRYEEAGKMYEQTINSYKTIVKILQNNVNQLQQNVSDYESKQNEKTKLTADYDLQIKLMTEHLDCMNKSLIETQIKLNTREYTISNLEKQLRRNQSALAAKNNETQLLTNKISEYSSALEEKNEQLQILSYSNDAQKTQIREFETKLNACDAKVQESDQKIATLTTQMTSSADKLRELNEMIASYATCCNAHSCGAFGVSTNIQTIHVQGVGAFKVLCNGQLFGPGWTVIQRRLNGSVNFYRNWKEYKTGFGDLTGEFFIGLEKLHHMTQAEPQELFIHLEDFEGNVRYIKYDNFEVGSEEEFYALKSLGNSKGNVSDSMINNVGQKFSTFDRDNDGAS